MVDSFPSKISQSTMVREWASLVKLRTSKKRVNNQTTISKKKALKTPTPDLKEVARKKRTSNKTKITLDTMASNSTRCLWRVIWHICNSPSTCSRCLVKVCLSSLWTTPEPWYMSYLLLQTRPSGIGTTICSPTRTGKRCSSMRFSRFTFTG